jgi:hypothetical protein
MHIHHHPFEAINLFGVFIVTPLPDLVALGHEAPNSMLNPTSGGNSIKYLSPKLEMFGRRFFLREYKGQPELVGLPTVQVSFVKAFSSSVQDIGNI